ncbi:hypothetical protein KCMC57_up22710 [Kitasatospora sp. CMC57]|uniref:Uncharacterized protein n=1 Tax=Kitasatospora sp. CMC57 TaxID=3231513 RepID=A0AB33JWT7_9ACTN
MSSANARASAGLRAPAYGSSRLFARASGFTGNTKDHSGWGVGAGGAAGRTVSWVIGAILTPVADP